MFSSIFLSYIFLLKDQANRKMYDRKMSDLPFDHCGEMNEQSMLSDGCSVKVSL
jgi:hypothetical protein